MKVDRRRLALLPIERWPTADEARGARWFQPLHVGRLRLEERTWIPAMVPWRASADGEVTDAVIAWYRRFAEGRPGAIVVEATGIRDVPSGPLLRAGHDRFLPGLERLANAVRDASGGRTRLFLQLIDFLAIKRRPDPQAFLRRFLKVDEALRARLPEELASADETTLREALARATPESLDAWLPPRELESLRMGYRERVTDLHLPHVRDLPKVLPELFASAADRVRRAGFDGVELHYAHAYTMASFLSRANDRPDGYGGDREARVRLPLEVHAATRATVGRDFVVGARFLGHEHFEGGSTLDDARAYALRFAAAGFDFLSISKGGKFEDAKQPRVGEAAYPYTGPSGHECMPTTKIGPPGPFGRNVHLAAAIRADLRAAGHPTPVVTAGGIASPWQAETILENEEADVVACARQALADPDFFRKVREGRGEEVRRCLFTNYCEGLDQKHREVTCQLWDREPTTEGELRSADGKRRLVAPAWS
ncbi:MAG: NADH:flavin oxidoreductase [Sandaracinus sp.]|nr:NADH:flavin oxidoreductase [Sandaracinus sp.]